MHTFDSTDMRMNSATDMRMNSATSRLVLVTATGVHGSSSPTSSHSAITHKVASVGMAAALLLAPSVTSNAVTVQAPEVRHIRDATSSDSLSVQFGVIAVTRWQPRRPY